ncbi:hypothetical protein BGZ83_002087 [Gryganskiella cystojenkinii]|nr:hypothetical protein BGZ83_002087 [Gryganskiella cystojenkinii]
MQRLSGGVPQVTIGDHRHFQARSKPSSPARRRPPTPYPPGSESDLHPDLDSSSSLLRFSTPSRSVTPVSQIPDPEPEDVVWATRIQAVYNTLNIEEPPRPVQHLQRRPAQYSIPSLAKLDHLTRSGTEQHNVTDYDDRQNLDVGAAKAVTVAAAMEDIVDVDEVIEAEHHHKNPAISASSHDLLKVPPSTTAPALAAAMPLFPAALRAPAEGSMDVDEAYEAEHHHQYPVISAYQSSHDVFKLPPCTTTVAAEVKVTTVPAITPLASQTLEEVGGERGNDNDVKTSTVSLVRGKASAAGTEVFHFAVAQEEERRKQTEAVTKWAEDQARIHKRRREKKKDQERAQALQDIRQKNHWQESTTATGGSLMRTAEDEPPLLLLKVRLEEDNVKDDDDDDPGVEDHRPFDTHEKEERLVGDGVGLERIETLGAGVGRP